MADEVETPADQLRISQIQIRNLPPDNKDVLEAVLLRGEENAVVCRIPLSRGTSAFCGACSSKALTVGLDLSALAESTAALKVAIRAVPKEPEEPPAEGEEPPPPAAALGTVPIGISPQLEKGLVEGPVLVTFEPDAPAPAAVVEEAKKPAGKPAKGGKGAKEAPKEAAAEAPPPPKRDTTVEVAGWWRLEAPLPDIASTNRIIPLAMRCGAWTRRCVGSLHHVGVPSQVHGAGGAPVGAGAAGDLAVGDGARAQPRPARVRRLAPLRPRGTSQAVAHLRRRAVARGAPRLREDDELAARDAGRAGGAWHSMAQHGA
jgi:hypothetical protein